MRLDEARDDGRMTAQGDRARLDDGQGERLEPHPTTASQDDEKEHIRREKMAIEEIRGLLAEMLEG